MPIVGRFGSLAGLGSLILPGGAMESIATVTVGSGGAASIEFTSIPGTYQHLQIRYLARGANASNNVGSYLQLNGNTANNYAYHSLAGEGATATAGAAASQAQWYWGFMPGANRTASAFGAGLVDLLDYASTSKVTTGRGFVCYDSNGAGFVELDSGLWNVTDAVTSVKLYPSVGNWVQHTTAALYGIKAP